MDSNDPRIADRTHSNASAVSSAPLVGTMTLRVVQGPDVGKCLIIHDAQPSRVFVGRSPSCELRLTDTSISRRHMAFELVEGQVRVIDLGSTNGTSVNDVRVVEAFLRGGETIRVGDTTFAVDRGTGAVAQSMPVAEQATFGRVYGASREMRRLYPLCERLAQIALPLLIEGETGTGKEVLAESIHEQGPRAAHPFIVFDCTTVAPNLLEAELFGHERGAFTGATEARAGVFEQAHEGTLLIDEIGDLDLSLQPKLLRLLDRKELRRVGGNKTIRVDVRVIGATRRDLDAEVQAGRFRDDLFHRLAIARIELPPLRRRRGDIPYLVSAIARQLGGDPVLFEGELLARWEAYAWPGNVRELRNAVARRLELGDLADWDAEAAPESAPAARPVSATEAGVVTDAIERILALSLPITEARKLMTAEFEQRYLERILEANGGVVTRAAAASGIARRHFHRLLAQGQRKKPPEASIR